MNYYSTHLNTTIRFMTSDMILALHSDVSYSSKPGAKVKQKVISFKNKTNREFNSDTLLTISKVIKHVMITLSKA